MSEEVKIEVELRKYLLGFLDATQTEEIEKNLVSDEEYFQEIQIVEAEIIQDFVDKKLNREEKKAFEENFIITDERREQINFARALRKCVDEKPKTQIEEKPSFFDSLKSFFLSPIPAICSVLVVVGVSIFVWWNYSNKSEVLVALNRSQKKERPTAARISDFDYAPKTEGTRGNDKSENLDLVFAKSRATEAVLKNPTAENYHELGRVFLAEKNFDESIKQFEKAVKLNPSIANLNNDLGVALMEKGRQKDEGSLELYARANESLEKSLELDKNLKEAYFNRALVIELLNLPNQAKEAWENYLKLDSTSKWADEARERLQKLEANKPISKTKEEILQDFLEAKKANDTEKAWQTLSRNREMITGKLIPQQLAFLFVDSKTSGDEATAKEALDALGYAGKLEAEKAGDLFWQNLTNYYKNFEDKEITLIKKAQESLIKGYELTIKRDFANSLEEFEKASKNFQEAGNEPQMMISNYYISNCLSYIEKKSVEDEVRRDELAKKLLKISIERNYKWLELLVLLRITSIQNEVAQFSSAIKNAEKSYLIAKDTENSYDEQRILVMLASMYSRLGNKKKAIEYSQKIFEKMNEADNSPRQKWRNFFNMTELFFSVKNYSVARLLVKEEVLLAEQLGDINQLSMSQIHAGIILAKAKDFLEARNSLIKGLQNAEKLPEGKAQKNLIAYSKLKIADLEQELGNFEESVRLYDESFKVNNSPYFELEVQKGQLRAFVETGNHFELEKQIPKTIQIAEENRLKILEEQQSNGFFHSEISVYETAINWEYERGNSEDSYNYVERSSARSLLDKVENNKQTLNSKSSENTEFFTRASPLKLKEIQAQISENTQLLQYTVLNDKTLIWLITRDKFIVEKVQISAEELQVKVERFIKLILNDKTSLSSETKEIAKEIYLLLINPIYKHLEKSKQICFIPNKSLFFLPFSALLNENERFLLEEFIISYAPSANVFLHCTKIAEKKNNLTTETILSIGNPEFDTTVFPELANLIAAESEAKSIAQLYDNPIVFSGKSATKKSFESNIKNVEVIHFAGHYVVKPELPLASSLLFAKDDDFEKSILTNAELINHKLNRIKLVVLSSCETGVESYLNGEGLIGLSRTFLALETPLVVASQWKVDSDSTAILMKEFHKFRREEKLPTSEALRKSQLKMLDDKKFNTPYYWAAFASFGGNARF